MLRNVRQDWWKKYNSYQTHQISRHHGAQLRVPLKLPHPCTSKHYRIERFRGPLIGHLIMGAFQHFQHFPGCEYRYIQKNLILFPDELKKKNSIKWNSAFVPNQMKNRKHIHNVIMFKPILKINLYFFSYFSINKTAMPR